MRLLRVGEVQRRLGGCARSTVYSLERGDPTFPRRRRISEGVAGWLESELDAWLAERPVASSTSNGDAP